MAAVEQMMCVVYVSVIKGHSGDGSDSSWTLWKEDLFVLSWVRVQCVRHGSISSELLMVWWRCGAVFCYHSCMYMVYVCFMSVVVTVWGSVGMFVV